MTFFKLTLFLLFYQRVAIEPSATFGESPPFFQDGEIGTQMPHEVANQQFDHTFAPPSQPT